MPVRASTKNNGVRGGAERHADANLGPAAAHRVRRDAVEAKAGEEQRQDAEERRQCRDDTLLRERGVDVILERSQGDSEIAVNLADRRDERPGQQHR